MGTLDAYAAQLLGHVRANPGPTAPLTVVGLFVGIGGIELGLHAHGHRTALFCESAPPAVRVLRAHFPDVPLVEDVRDLTRLPDADLVTAGFPCTDLSQAGKTEGITGARSGLVGEVFRLLRTSHPRWVLLENVPFMLALDQGKAMHVLANALRELGFRWAYRVVDTRAFGLPQRRQRVFLLASRTEDPRTVLFADDAGEPAPRAHPTAYGFYWTEGFTGLGWAVDAVPTIKGGSSLGIPSPPAIWIPATDELVTPDLRDAERLQGFPADWTVPAVADTTRKTGPRWKLVGNAVSVPVAAWIGARLRAPGEYIVRDGPLRTGARWPDAAWADAAGSVQRTDVSRWPLAVPYPPLLEYLRYPTRPLSPRAAAGFHKRMSRSRLRFDPRFREAVKSYLARTR